MKKRVLGAVLAAVMVLAACGQQEIVTDVASKDKGTEVEIEVVDGVGSWAEVVPNRVAPEAPTDYVTEEMLAEATNFANVNYARLRDVMLRAEAGEDIIVGVIGGSITQGSSATAEKNSYASIMEDWWVAAFPESEIRYVNAGIGGTDSYFGVHRMGPDLLVYQPDFVIVEYSVNDSNDNFHKNTYENVVRRILTQSNDPAVMLLYMTMEDGTCAQSNDALVGFYYNLPQISYHDTIMARMQAGDLTWKEISPDNIHPNDYGHAICGELIWKYLSNVYETLDEIQEEYEVPATAQTNDAYMNAKIATGSSLKPDVMEGFTEGSVDWCGYSNGWSCQDGGTIEFTVEAKRIGVLYYKSVSGDYGTADVYVDGEHKAALVGDFSKGWGNYGNSESIFSEKESGTHTVRIEVPEGKKFDILGILVAE